MAIYVDENSYKTTYEGSAMPELVINITPASQLSPHEIAGGGCEGSDSGRRLLYLKNLTEIAMGLKSEEQLEAMQAEFYKYAWASIHLREATISGRTAKFIIVCESPHNQDSCIGKQAVKLYNRINALCKADPRHMCIEDAIVRNNFLHLLPQTYVTAPSLRHKIPKIDPDEPWTIPNIHNSRLYRDYPIETSRTIPMVETCNGSAQHVIPDSEEVNENPPPWRRQRPPAEPEAVSPSPQDFEVPGSSNSRHITINENGFYVEVPLNRLEEASTSVCHEAGMWVYDCFCTCDRCVLVRDHREEQDEEYAMCEECLLGTNDCRC
jgi:hypothetical protein